MGTYVYILDIFKPVEVEPGEIMRFIKQPLELFKYIENTVVNELQSIENVEVRDVYIDRETNEVLIEYIVRYSKGRVSVKLINSEYPEKTLYKYYEHEQRKLLRY